MSEVDEFLLENEKILYEVHKGVIPWLFGGLSLYLTNMRSIKVTMPGLFSRRSFNFLPHSVAMGQATLPSWNLVILFCGIFISIAIGSLLQIIRFDIGLSISILIILLLFTLILARRTIFIIFGKPSISMELTNSEVIDAFKIIARQQSGIMNNMVNKTPTRDFEAPDKNNPSLIVFIAFGFFGAITWVAAMGIGIL